MLASFPLEIRSRFRLFQFVCSRFAFHELPFFSLFDDDSLQHESSSTNKSGRSMGSQIYGQRVHHPAYSPKLCTARWVSSSDFDGNYLWHCWTYAASKIAIEWVIRQMDRREIERMVCFLFFRQTFSNANTWSFHVCPVLLQSLCSWNIGWVHQPPWNQFFTSVEPDLVGQIKYRLKDTMWDRVFHEICDHESWNGTTNSQKISSEDRKYSAALRTQCLLGETVSFALSCIEFSTLPNELP